MIRFRCRQCNALLQVSEDTAGRRGKCPGCGYVNVVPFASDEGLDATAGQRAATQAGPPMMAEPVTRSSVMRDRGAARRGRRRRRPREMVRNLAITSGLLMLVTVVMPWFVAPQTVVQSPNEPPSMELGVVFSWDLLVNEQGDPAPPELWAVLLLAWLVGAGALGLSALPTRSARGVAYACLGIVGILPVLAMAVMAMVGEGGLPVEISPVSGVLWVLLVLAGAGMLASLHVRVNVGLRPGVRASQGIFAGLGALLSLVGLVLVVISFMAAVDEQGQEAVHLFEVVGLSMVELGWLFGSILVLLDATNRKGKLASMAAATLYLVLVGVALYLMIGVVLRTGVGGTALAVINSLFIVGGLLSLLVGGLESAISEWILRADVRREDRAGGGAGLDSRRPVARPVAQVVPDGPSVQPGAPVALEPLSESSARRPPVPRPQSTERSAGKPHAGGSPPPPPSPPINMQQQQLAILEQQLRSGQITQARYRELRARLLGE